MIYILGIKDGFVPLPAFHVSVSTNLNNPSNSFLFEPFTSPNI